MNQVEGSIYSLAGAVLYPKGVRLRASIELKTALCQISDHVNQQDISNEIITDFEHESGCMCPGTHRVRATSCGGKERFNLSLHLFWKAV